MTRAHPLEILFEDEHVIVLNKASGLLTIADRFDHQAPNLRALLTKRFGEIFVVHRLDRDTSGVIVFAKTQQAHRDLNEQFEQRTTTKIYHALAAGIVSQDELRIDIPLLRDPSNSGLMRPSARGKESLTLIKTLKRYRVATLLECDLRTGRQHQIRVHLGTIGHPLLVDADYGTSSEFYLSSIKRRYNLKKGEEERPLMARNALHAYELRFRHPASSESVHFLAPYPKDFRATIQVLDKYARYRIGADWEWSRTDGLDRLSV